MNVQDVMTKSPRICRGSDSLVDAARVLWDNDCGIVPVVDDAGRPVGTVTDRDCCMAAYTRGRRLDEIPVATAMAKVVFTVRADEPVGNALLTMGKKQVRRLPVVDAQGRLCGIVSCADLLVRAGKTAAESGALVEALTAIAAPRPAVSPAGTPRREVAAVMVPKAPTPAAAPAAAPASLAGSSASVASKSKTRGKKR